MKIKYELPKEMKMTKKEQKDLEKSFRSFILFMLWFIIGLFSGFVIIKIWLYFIK